MPYAVEMRLGVQVPMRDGVNLSADIYLPKAHGPFPTVLVRTPYSNNSAPAVQRARALANNGYVCVLQDTRGRWDSGGDYYPLQGEGVDGYDTQEWIGRQPWSNGKIATSGGSYLGHVQWQSAPYGSQYLTAMTPRVIGPNFFKALRPGGVEQPDLVVGDRPPGGSERDGGEADRRAVDPGRRCSSRGGLLPGVAVAGDLNVIVE